MHRYQALSGHGAEGGEVLAVEVERGARFEENPGGTLHAFARAPEDHQQRDPRQRGYHE
jgi:hypothetical protein